MVKNYESFYEGSTNIFDPYENDLSSEYRISASRIGSPTSIQTANQISEVSARLSEGVKVVELQPIADKVFETIPKQHMREISRLAKLTGSEISLHAPIIDPAGFTEYGWDENSRERAENNIWNVIERGHELNPKGNVPIVIHASKLPAAEFKKEGEKEVKEMLVAVNQRDGRLVGLKREKEFYPDGKEVIKTPEEKIKISNETEWQNSLRPMIEHLKTAEDRLNESWPLIGPKIMKGELNEKKLTPEEKQAINNLERANFFLNHAYAEMRNLYDVAYKYGNEKTKEQLKKFSQEFKSALEKIRTPTQELEVLTQFTAKLAKIKPPQIYKPVEEFAVEKAGKTFGHVAFKAFEKWKDKAPIINIENVFPEMAFSRAEQLKKLIEKSREEFIHQAIEKGYSREEAKEAAKKLIGATWDVGHINLLRRLGFSKKKIIEETKKIAPYVKHVHLTDNFGYEDSHLPPGMGEVPIKEMLKELEKSGFKGKTIVEAGGFVSQFKVSPHPYVLEALGSPLYPAIMQPYWNQIRGTYGHYFSGYGMMLPEQHFSMYGAGFSSLPAELGGQILGRRSKLSGTPLE